LAERKILDFASLSFEFPSFGLENASLGNRRAEPATSRGSLRRRVGDGVK